VEGRTRLLVPEGWDSPVPPKEPAFYNPNSALARDLSVSIYRAATELAGAKRMADSLSSLGARGIRVAVEVDGIELVMLNDLNPRALELARRSAELNGVSDKVKLFNLECCEFLDSLGKPGSRPDIVDIDPFGSPAPYLDCGLRSVRNGGLLSVTATDTPVLCGNYPRLALARYYGLPLRCEYMHEVGLRLLYGAIARVATRLGLGIEPVYSQSVRHYMRAYSVVRKGRAEVERTIDRIGYLMHCDSCGFRELGPEPLASCRLCGSKYRVAGPLWIGELFSAEYVKKALELSVEDYMRRARKLLSIAVEEVGKPATYFDLDNWARKARRSSPSPSRVVELLRDMGFLASRTSLNPKGIRTNATPRELIRAISSADES